MTATTATTAAAPRVLAPPPQRVLVTGGASGLGLVVAKRFRAAGARVHVADADGAAIAEMIEAGSIHGGTAGDWSVPTHFERVLQDVLVRLGGLDVLVYVVHALAAPDPQVNPGAQGAQAFRQVGQLIQNSRAASALLKRAFGSSLILIAPCLESGPLRSSTDRHPIGTRFRGLPRMMALEHGDSPTTCNGVLVGTLAGPERMRLAEADDAGPGDTSSAVSGEGSDPEQAVPTGRLVDPLDVAAIVLFLAGPHARRVTGQTFVVGPLPD